VKSRGLTIGVSHRKSEVSMTLRNFHRKIPGTDLDRPLVETRGGDRGVGSRDIDIPVDRRSGKSIVKTPI
jgi:hypothetical protein